MKEHQLSGHSPTPYRFHAPRPCRAAAYLAADGPSRPILPQISSHVASSNERTDAFHYVEC